MGKSNFLVTGAYGFIGAWVVKGLLGTGENVVAMDLKDDPHRLRLILDEDELSKLNFVESDVTDADDIKEIVRDNGITHIIHLAGLQVPACRANPRLGAMVNVIGTINVFDAAISAGDQVRKIVYASSAAVFSPKEDGGSVTESDAGGMDTHYGAFKLCNENNAMVYFQEKGISSAGLRPLTVYGVGRDTGMTSDPTKAMKAAVAGRPFHIRFGGRTDFLYVADCADAFIKAAVIDMEGALVFNLHGETVGVAEVVKEIERKVPSSIGTITFDEKPLNLPSKLEDAGIRNLISDLAYTPLSTGVKETIDRFRVLKDEDRLDLSDLEE